MPYFEPAPDRPISSEMIRQGFAPSADEALEIIHLDESASGTDSTIALATAAIGVACSAGILALNGLTAPILLPLGALGFGAVTAWNSRLTQRARASEGEFLEEHGNILELAEQKLSQGQPAYKVAAAIESALRAWNYGESPQLTLGAASSPVSAQTSTIGAQTQLGAIPTPALPIAGKTCGQCQNFAKNGDGFRLDIGNESQFDGGCRAFMQPANSQDPGSNCPQFAAKNAVSSPPVDTAGFDWQWLNTRYDDYPHILILGKTGAGKSYLAERLGRFLTGSTLVLTPKKKPGTFAGLEVVGVPYNFAAIANRLSAITQLVKDRESEMDRTGREDFEPLNVILDDTPSFIAGCKDEGYDVVKDLKFIIRNARTSKVRLIILVQGAEVKALGIEGEGSLRDCLSYIRLRGFAEPYAKSLGDVIARQVAAMDRPATVEDMPADVMELCRVADGMPAPSVPVQSVPASAIHYPPPAPDHQGRTEKPSPVTTMPAPDLEKSAATLEQQIADFIKAYPPGNGGLKLREIKRKFRNEEPKKVEGICLTLARCFPDKFRISEDTVGGNKTIKVEAIT